MKRFFQVVGLGLIAVVLMAQQPVNIQTNASVNNAQVAGASTATAASGVQKVGVVGNAGAAFDVSSNQNQAAPANMILMGGEFNTTPTTITSGNVSPFQLDSGGKLLVNPGTPAVTQSGGWTVQPGNTANTTPWLTTDSATSSTGAAVPSKAAYVGGNGSGNLTGQVMCDKNFIVNAFSTSGSTQEVAASGSTKIYVCGFAVNSAATTAVTFKLVYGTGTNCATSPADLSIAVPLQAVASTAPVGQNVSPPSNVVWSTTASQALCVNLSAAQAVNAQVWYTQF